MSVSVIIPTYNRIKTLPVAVDSVLAQTYSDIELIIVDDGSEDGTDEYIKTISDTRVIYIKGGHHGAGAARNTGVKVSKNELIAFCDSDCFWYPEKLEKQIALLNKNPETAMVYCRFREIYFDGSEGMTIPIDDIPEIECNGNFLFQHLLRKQVF